MARGDGPRLPRANVGDGPLADCHASSCALFSVQAAQREESLAAVCRDGPLGNSQELHYELWIRVERVAPLARTLGPRTIVIACRYYNVRGVKLEACFFRKGDHFPETDAAVPRQGVWARPVESTWEHRYFLGGSWRLVQLDPDLIYLPEKKP